MLTLSRVVRFAVNDPGPTPENRAAGDGAPGSLADSPRANGFAGVPAMRGFGRHYELAVTCRGGPDAVTGYFINIRDIDLAARRSVIPRIERACRDEPRLEPATLVPELWGLLDAALGHGRLFGLRLNLTPTYSVGIEGHDMSTVILRQQFDFAASHRLHSPSLSAEENRRTFGRCNNPSGHGHNYRLEAAVAIPANDAGRFTLADLERVTLEAVIDRFDHKHLNADTPEFGPGGLNPSVENIARVCYERLAPAVRDASAGGATLRHVTVWETDRTSCSYPG